MNAKIMLMRRKIRLTSTMAVSFARFFCGTRKSHMLVSRVLRWTQLDAARAESLTLLFTASTDGACSSNRSTSLRAPRWAQSRALADMSRTDDSPEVMCGVRAFRLLCASRLNDERPCRIYSTVRNCRDPILNDWKCKFGCWEIATANLY